MFFPSESDVQLYSNDVEFTLPVPEEILSVLHKPKDDEDSTGDCDGEDGDVPGKELLLVAERVIPQSSVPNTSRIKTFSLKSVASKLQTIPEDQQLDIMATEANDENMENVPFVENGATEAEPREQQYGVQEQTDTTVIEERIPVVETEGDFHDSPHDASLLEEAAKSELVFELDATIFRDRGESVSAKDANLGPLEEETEAEEIETQMVGGDTGEEDFGEHSDVDKEILDNERNDDDSSDQQGNQGNGSSKEEPEKNGVSYQATYENDKTEVESMWDNEAETFGTERISEQSDSDFWDHGEKQHEEGITKEATVNLAAHSDDNGHTPSHSSSQNDVEHHESKHAADFQEHLDIKTHDSDTRKDYNEQEHGYFEGLEQGIDTDNNHESQARDNDVGLDTNVHEPITELISKRNAQENNSPDKDNGSSDVQEASNSGNNAAGDDDKSAVNAEIGETWQKERDGNAKLSLGVTDAEEPKESGEHKDECYEKGDDPELKVEEGNQLDKEVERGLESDQPLEKILTKLLQEPPSNISMVENQDISLPEEEKDEDRDGKRFRENSTIDEPMLCKNVNSGESKIMVKHSEQVMSDQVHSMDDVTGVWKPSAKEDKQTCYEVSKDTWSASSNLGSVKNEDDDNKDEMETTDMPIFEEAAFKGGVLLSQSNIEDSDGLQQGDNEHEISYSKRNEERPLRGDSLQGEIWCRFVSGED